MRLPRDQLAWDQLPACWASFCPITCSNFIGDCTCITCPLQVSALFHIASSKGGPPIPESLSPEAKDFLQLCCNRCARPYISFVFHATYAHTLRARASCRNPKERPNATRLLKHPFLQAASKPHTTATPLTNISVARDHFLPGAWRAPAGSISPIPEEARDWPHPLPPRTRGCQ